MLHTKRTCKHKGLQINTIVTKTLALASYKLADNPIPHLLNLHCWFYWLYFVDRITAILVYY
jgi:hypothetical protein